MFPRSNWSAKNIKQTQAVMRKSILRISLKPISWLKFFRCEPFLLADCPLEIREKSVNNSWPANRTCEDLGRRRQRAEKQSQDHRPRLHPRVVSRLLRNTS